MAAGAQMVKLEGGAEFADTIDSHAARRSGVRTSPPHAAIRATSSAATACRARARTPSRS